MAHASQTAELKAYARALGFDLVGVTSAEPFPETERVLLDRIERGLMRGLDWFTPERARFSANPRNHLPGARSILSLGMSYLDDGRWTIDHGRRTMRDDINPSSMVRGPSSIVHGPSSAPLSGRVARYARGEDYHRAIGERLKLVGEWLRARAGASVPPKGFVDTGRIVDRAVAQRAGLGWFGKNTHVLTRSHGSWVFLAEVLTDVGLEPDQPVRTTCGACTRCLDGCPTGAIVAPGVLDNARCISYLTIELRGWMPRELRPLVGDWVFGCDVCQEVCPVNRKAQPGGHSELAADRGIGAAPELAPLLGLAEEEFRARFRGTPITRAKRRGLARNAAVALGNLGDDRAVPALVVALAGPDPLVRGHGAWALGRLGDRAGRLALEAALAREEDAQVREELEQALDGRRPE
jgi:epoxyqueuosine reductase